MDGFLYFSGVCRCRAFAIRVALALCFSVIQVYSQPVSASALQKVQCDPHRSSIDAAVRLRDGREYAKARASLQKIIDQDPNDFRASFILATVLIQSEKRLSSDDAGMVLLHKAESLLISQPRECIDRYGWYSIYNTLGSQSYRRNDVKSADHYLTLALNNVDKLYPDTKQRLLINLGILRLHQGRVDEALKYFEKAQAAGSKSAGKYIRTLKRLKNVVSDG